MITLIVEKAIAEETLNVLDEFLNCNCKCRDCFNFERANRMVKILVNLLKEGE